MGQCTSECRVHVCSAPLTLLILHFLPLSIDISQARCILLACYSIQDLKPHAIQQGKSRRHWFESIKLVPWMKILHVLWFLMNDDFTSLFPPCEVCYFSYSPDSDINGYYI